MAKPKVHARSRAKRHATDAPEPKTKQRRRAGAKSALKHAEESQADDPNLLVQTIAMDPESNDESSASSDDPNNLTSMGKSSASASAAASSSSAGGGGASTSQAKDVHDSDDGDDNDSDDDDAEDNEAGARQAWEAALRKACTDAWASTMGRDDVDVEFLEQALGQDRGEPSLQRLKLWTRFCSDQVLVSDAFVLEYKKWLHENVLSACDQLSGQWARTLRLWLKDGSRLRPRFFPGLYEPAEQTMVKKEASKHAAAASFGRALFVLFPVIFEGDGNGGIRGGNGISVLGDIGIHVTEFVGHLSAFLVKLKDNAASSSSSGQMPMQRDWQSVDMGNVALRLFEAVTDDDHRALSNRMFMSHTHRSTLNAAPADDQRNGSPWEQMRNIVNGDSVLRGAVLLPSSTAGGDAEHIPYAPVLSHPARAPALDPSVVPVGAYRIKHEADAKLIWRAMRTVMSKVMANYKRSGNNSTDIDDPGPPQADDVEGGIDSFVDHAIESCKNAQRLHRQVYDYVAVRISERPREQELIAFTTRAPTRRSEPSSSAPERDELMQRLDDIREANAQDRSELAKLRDVQREAARELKMTSMLANIDALEKRIAATDDPDKIRMYKRLVRSREDALELEDAARRKDNDDDNHDE